jgi:hypothetical protein
MIDQARRECSALDDVEFHVGELPRRADVIVASGVFNVMTQGTRVVWGNYVWNTLDALCESAKIAVAFNLLLEPTPPYRARDDLYWASPEAVVARFRDKGLKCNVQMSYGLHEATYLVEIQDDDTK